MPNRWLLVGLVACLAATPSYAEVRDSSAGGFTVRHEVTVPGTPARAWASFVDLAQWWSSDHTFSGNAANLSLEPRAGACFCERMADGGGVEHLQVVFVKPGERLRLRGGLGPLQSMAVSGALTVEFAAQAGAGTKGAGTRVSLTYTVGGYTADGLSALAAPVDGMLGEQLARYAARATAAHSEHRP